MSIHCESLSSWVHAQDFVSDESSRLEFVQLLKASYLFEALCHRSLGFCMGVFKRVFEKFSGGGSYAF